MTKEDDQSKPDSQTDMPSKEPRGVHRWRDIKRGTERSAPEQESIASLLEEAYQAGVEHERKRCSQIVGARARVSTYSDSALWRIAGEAFAMVQEINGLQRCNGCRGTGTYEERGCEVCEGQGWMEREDKCSVCMGKGFTWSDVYTEEHCEDCGGRGFVTPQEPPNRAELRKNHHWLVNSERDACAKIARRIAKDNIEACARFPNEGMMIEARALNLVADWIEERGAWKWMEGWGCHRASVDEVDLRVYPHGHWVVWVSGQSQADGDANSIREAKLAAVRRARQMAQEAAADYTDYVLSVLERDTLAAST